MKTKELRLLIKEELAKELKNSSLITPINEKLDPVGKEDDDVDNDGDVDKTDKYLLNRRKAIKKAVDKQDVKKESYNPDAEQDDEDVPNPVDDEGKPLDVKEAYADLSPEERLKVGKEYDHETIAQAYLNKMGRDSNLKSDDLLKIGKKVVFLNYDGDLGAAYKDLVKEALNPEVSKTVNNLIKAMAKRYDYSEQDAVFAIMAALKQRDFDGLVKEFKGETGEKRLDNLLDIILKYVEDPDNAEEELQNYIDSGYPGFSDMLKANLDRDLDFQTWVQVGHDRGLEEAKGSTLKLSAEDMEKLHKDGKLEIGGHKILYATGKPKVNEDIDLGHEDNEPHMLKADLYRIGKYSMDLYKILDGFDDGETEFDFPHWWQSKIIKAKSMLVSAKHYLDFELKEPEIDAIVNVASEEEVIDEELFTPNEMGAEATERESEGPGY